MAQTTKGQWVPSLLWDGETRKDILSFRPMGEGVPEGIAVSTCWPRRGNLVEIAAALRGLADNLEKWKPYG